MTTKATFVILSIVALALIISGVVFGLLHESSKGKGLEPGQQPTTTATAKPTASVTSIPTAKATDTISGGCVPGDCWTTYTDFGSTSLEVKCGECWDGDKFYYYGDFIYEDEPDRGYSNLRNPSYEELMAFLEVDKTDEIPANPPEFVCHHFSLTLRENANKQGLRCACVIVEWVPVEGGYGLNYVHAMSAL